MTDLGISGIGDAKLIASGGSALVYSATSEAGHQVAVKVLRGIRGAEVTRRFEREQRAAERLREHPKIIEVSHSGVSEAGEPYLIMPLMRRGSLADELERGVFPVDRAVGDVLAATEAIDFAHRRGVLHRDLKPGNLLRTDDDSIVVTDFGIARVLDAGITSATIGATTPLYAAPELLSDNAASVQSDVYSLAAVLYALLAGAPAFSDSPNIWATIARIRTEEPTPIALVPKPVMRVVEQAMSKDPSGRPSTAHQFHLNLLAAVDADDDWYPPSPAALTVPAPPPGPAVVPAVVIPHPDSPTPTVGPRAAALNPADVSAATTADFGGDPRAPIGPAAPASGPPPAPGPPPTPGPFDVPSPTPIPQHRPVGHGSGVESVAASTASSEPTAPTGPPSPRRQRNIKLVAWVGALFLLGGLAWLGVSRVIASNGEPDATEVTGPTDTSIPSPTSVSNTQDDGDDSGESAGRDSDPDAESVGDGASGADGRDPEPSPTATDRLVSFTGTHFSAYFPEGWSVSRSDIDVGYGYRSQFVGPADMYLNVDTTPAEQRGAGSISDSAREIAASTRSASAVTSETVNGLELYSFTFRNNRGVESIDIFFEVDGDGYAVVAGSNDQTEAAFAIARQVAQSIRSSQ